MGERGFTLVELLVVLAIMAILLAVAIPRLTPPARGGGYRAALAEARVALNRARMAAIGSGRPTAPTFDVKAGGAGIEATGSAKGAPLLFFADGSSTGGAVTLGGKTILTIDWFAGEVSDVRG